MQKRTLGKLKAEAFRVIGASGSCQAKFSRDFVRYPISPVCHPTPWKLGIVESYRQAC
jgi:hypothetical protein